LFQLVGTASVPKVSVVVLGCTLVKIPLLASFATQSGAPGHAALNAITPACPGVVPTLIVPDVSEPLTLALVPKPDEIVGIGFDTIRETLNKG